MLPSKLAHILIAIVVGGSMAHSPVIAQDSKPLLHQRPAGPRENPSALTGVSVSEVSLEDAFGTSLAVLENGAGVLVGAPNLAIEGLSGKGAAYLIQPGEGGHWILREKLVGHERNSLEELGYSVAAGEGFLAVAAPGVNQVLIYHPQPDGRWTLQNRLSPQIAGKSFGGSLAADGDTLAIGAVQGVYLYVKYDAAEGGWRYHKRISLTGIAGGPCQVALSGETLLVGCQLLKSTGEQEIGGAAIFSRDEGGRENWGQVKSLSFPLARPGAEIGTSVALGGAVAAVGSRRGGAIYLFENSATGWALTAVLTLLRQDGWDARFGAGLALQGSFLVAGAPGERVETNEVQGAAYVLERNAGGEGNWGTVARWTSSEGQAQDAFGNRVALRGNLAAIGGLRRNGDEPPQVYLTELPPLGLPDLRLASSALSSIAERLKPRKAETPPAETAPEAPEEVVAEPGAGPEFKITSSQVISPPIEAGPGFGAALSFSPRGDCLAVGEPATQAGQPGRTHIYRGQADAWKRLAILPPSKLVAPGEAQSFGGVLSLGDDGLLAIGGEGVAEIWVQIAPDSSKWARLEWTSGQALPPETGFGAAATVWGGLVAIGAPRAEPGGVVRIFRVDRATGHLEQLPALASPANSPGAEFGAALSWSAAGLAVGAPNAITKGGARGAAYHYRLNSAGTGLDLVSEVPTRDRESTGTFGRQMALGENLWAISDSARDMMDLRRPGRLHSGLGAVTIYTRPGKSRWQQSSALTSLLGAPNRGFGRRIALDAKAEILAVLADSPSNPGQAAVHVFRPREALSSGSRWVEVGSYTSPTRKDALIAGNPPVVKGGLAMAPGKLAAGLKASNGQSGGIWVLNWPVE